MIRRTQGFTYLGLLFAIMLLGVVTANASVLWHTQSRREKEQELLFVGNEYAKAIDSYHAVQVNGHNAYPRTLDELLDDHRFPMPVRHLRRRYRDPVTNTAEWGLVKDGDDITGVYSLSQEMPLKQAGFGECCAAFAGAKRYAEWRFGSSAGGTPAASSPTLPSSATSTTATNTAAAGASPAAAMPPRR